MHIFIQFTSQKGLGFCCCSALYHCKSVVDLEGRFSEGRFIFDKRKKFFTPTLARHLHRLPREAVAASSLELFKARLDGALSNLGWWKVSLPLTGGLGLDDL